MQGPAQHPGGMPFALAGETVVPGIAAGDADGIFEEHSVVVSLRAAPARAPFYARSERVFCFGPVLASISQQTCGRRRRRRRHRRRCRRRVRRRGA